MSEHASRTSSTDGGMGALLEVLDRHEVPYFIDSGVLLGLRRSGALLDWEKDIDLGVLGDGLPALLACARPLEEAGYRVLVNRYRGVVYSVGAKRRSGTGPDALRAAIHVYYDRGRWLWSPQTQIYVPPPAPDLYLGQRSLVGRRLRRLVERWLYREETADGRQSRPPDADDSLIYRVSRWTYRRIDRGWMAETWPIREVYVPMTWIIPKELVAPLGQLRVGEVTYPVPGRVDDYLTYRYGDWRTPVRDWCYWEDDGAIRRMRPDRYRPHVQTP